MWASWLMGREGDSQPACEHTGTLNAFEADDTGSKRASICLLSYRSL